MRERILSRCNQMTASFCGLGGKRYLPMQEAAVRGDQPADHRHRRAVPDELFYFNNGYDHGLRLMVDGEIPGPERFWQSVEDFEAALADNGPMPEGGIGPDPDSPHGTTGTGLDQIIDIIMADEVWRTRFSPVQTVPRPWPLADLINGLIVEAMNATRAALMVC